jgi:hypothetical protein
MLRIIDYTGQVGASLHHTLAALAAIEVLLASDPGRPPHTRPQRDGLVLRALCEVYQLRRFARLAAPPLLPSGELFHSSGIRHLDRPSNDLVVRSTVNPSANYLPWFQGKIANAECRLYELCELSDGLMAGAAEVSAPVEPQEHAARERLHLALYSAREALQDVTDLIEAGVLKIQHVVRAA